MFDIKKIQEISKTSKVERWAYPRTFTALKEIGVEYYDVEISTHQITYHGNRQNFVEPAPVGFQTLVVAEIFDGDLVKKAIDKHQKEKTSYLDFLMDIAKAGVHSYRVDMAKKAIVYRGRNPGEEHIEKVPQS